MHHVLITCNSNCWSRSPSFADSHQHARTCSYLSINCRVGSSSCLACEKQKCQKGCERKGDKCKVEGMIKRCTNGDTDTPNGKENPNQCCWDPRLNLFGDLVRITEGLKTRSLDLLFFSFSLKHIVSLVGQEQFHQGEAVPNAGPRGYQGISLGHHATSGSSLRADAPQRPQHQSRENM